MAKKDKKKPKFDLPQVVYGTARQDFYGDQEVSLTHKLDDICPRPDLPPARVGVYQLVEVQHVSSRLITEPVGPVC